MSLASRVENELRSRAARRSADPITLEELGVLLAQNAGLSTRSGITVTDRRVFGLTAWYSGVRYLAESVSFLPVHSLRDTGTLADPRRERRANPPWLASPDLELPWGGWVEFGMYSLLHRGNFCSFKLRDDVGRVQGLRPIHPDNVRFAVDPESGRKVFRVRTDDGSDWIPFSSREVLHVPGLSTDGKFGINPIRAQAEALGGIAAANEASHRYYANASHPAGIIELPQELNVDERTRLKAEWEDFHQGLKNRDRIGVLSKGGHYNPISLNAEDAQLIEVRKWGVIEVAQILRIPPHKLYELTRATFTNIEHQSIEAVVDSVRPWVERIETYVNTDRDLVVPRTFIEFQLEGLLRGDTATRYEAYRKALGGHPWMTPNEPRRLENMPLRPELDFVPSPVNVGVVGAGEDRDVERSQEITDRLDRLEVERRES